MADIVGSVKHAVLALLLVVAACGSDDAGGITHDDEPSDCRSAFGEGPAECGPGADITSVGVDDTGPIILTIELSEAPSYDTDFQWLVEFSISDLACGLTNTSTAEERFVGSDVIGPYGYRIITNESAPLGTCGGLLEGTTATIVFNIQRPEGPWSITGGTQRVEIANLDDDGSSDDFVIEMTTTP